MIQSAERELPALLADVIRRERAPFLQGIFDYEAPAMVRGRVLLLGDSAFVVRPHTAMGVAKAAGDAMALRDSLRYAENMHQALLDYQAKRLPLGQRIAQYGVRLGRAFNT